MARMPVRRNVGAGAATSALAQALIGMGCSYITSANTPTLPHTQTSITLTQISVITTSGQVTSFSMPGTSSLSCFMRSMSSHGSGMMTGTTHVLEAVTQAARSGATVVAL